MYKGCWKALFRLSFFGSCAEYGIFADKMMGNYFLQEVRGINYRISKKTQRKKQTGQVKT